MEVIFNKINTAENATFRIYVEFDNNLINFVFLGNNGTWKCNIAADDLQKRADEHQMSLHDYRTKLLTYLEHPNGDVTFDFSSNQFIIYRNLKVGRMKYFYSVVEKVDYFDCVDQIIANFHKENRDGKETLNILSKQNEDLEKVNTEYEKKFYEFIEQKKTDDEKLLGNFVQVLNEKKRQIQHLNDLLDAFRAGRSVKNPTVSTSAKSKKRKKHEEKTTAKKNRKEIISESEEEEEESNSYESDSGNENNLEEEYNTDNEENDGKSSNSEDNAKPSTSKETYNLLIDDDTPNKNSLVIPKRNKMRNVTETTGCSCNLEMSASDHEEDPKSPEAATIENQESKPSGVDYNTQDLLDLM